MLEIADLRADDAGAALSQRHPSARLIRLDALIKDLGPGEIEKESKRNASRNTEERRRMVPRKA